MADVSLAIGGRAYKVSCRDGEEPAIRAAGNYLDSKTAGLTDALGALGEARLLLMAALQVTGELLDERQGRTPPAAGFDTGRLAGLVARTEALADALSAIAGAGLEDGDNRA